MEACFEPLEHLGRVLVGRTDNKKGIKGHLLQHLVQPGIGMLNAQRIPGVLKFFRNNATRCDELCPGYFVVQIFCISPAQSAKSYNAGSDVAHNV